MGVRINQNTSSLVIRHNLDLVTEALNTSYERISSGTRINKAGDDAAGLAFSQSLRNDIRGLNQAVRNINDGISVTSSVDSSMSSISDDLNRIRELAVQSANATLSDSNRALSDQEVQSLVAEIQRVATTSAFNGKNLLDGSYVNARIQTGVSSGQYLSISIPSMKADVLGARAQVTGQSSVSTTPMTGAAGELVINGFNVPASVSDGVSTGSAAASAIAKANAINQISGLSGVTATAQPTVFSQAGASISAVALNGTTSFLKINGVNIGAVTVNAGDSTSNLRTQINALTGQTGVTASLGAGGELVLTASDGRNIQIDTGGSVADELGLKVGNGDLAGQLSTGAVTLSSIKTITVGGTLGLIGFGAGQAATNVDPATALSKMSVSSASSAQETIKAVDAAISYLQSARANVGASQNRLQDAATNLSSDIENLSSADSQIRDTDFAMESARLAQQQILQQASVAVLAQANALPSSILQILNQQ
jgi:flagellin